MKISGKLTRLVSSGTLIALLVVTSYSVPQASRVEPGAQAVLDRISPDSLRGHLSFIASDALEGRNTPSRGLDIAAEYIAAQFRRAGLTAVGDDGYFQTAPWLYLDRDMSRFQFAVTTLAETIRIPANQSTFSFPQTLNLASVAIFKTSSRDVALLDSVDPSKIQGKIILADTPDMRGLSVADSSEIRRTQSLYVAKLVALNPALIVFVDRISSQGAGGGAGRLIDPENPQAVAGNPTVPTMTVFGPAVVSLFDAIGFGSTDATLTASLPGFEERKVKLRNVIGIIPGTDPILKDTYVLVTAHYDHLGTREGGADTVFNGANDDGSGTVSVIELASALATIKERPKRTLVFMTVFGEEKGLLGSRYYGRHPIFPIAKTVADINLEQVGRTDSTEGPQIGNATLTGFDYSSIGTIFQEAGALTGITVYKHERNSDSYFGRSDNQALADQGVPAHTLCVAFNYPDYHGLGDHYDKVDFDNMAKVDRMVALSLIMIANNPVEPKWNEANARTARYVTAWQKQHPSPSSTPANAVQPIP